MKAVFFWQDFDYFCSVSVIRSGTSSMASILSIITWCNIAGGRCERRSCGDVKVVGTCAQRTVGRDHQT